MFEFVERSVIRQRNTSLYLSSLVVIVLLFPCGGEVGGDFVIGFRRGGELGELGRGEWDGDFAVRRKIGRAMGCWEEKDENCY